jgi:hypothetical protein
MSGIYTYTFMKRHVALPLTLTLAASLAGPLLAGKNESLAGTWKLNVEKSKYSTGAPPKAGTRTIEMQADGEKTTGELTDADGGQMSFAYSVNYDGKDSPLTGAGKPTWREDLFSGADSISMRRTGSNSFGASFKKGGQVVMTMREMLSKDGKVLTITRNGADAKGQPTSYVLVWEKQ